jgi:hypothetical protein
VLDDPVEIAADQLLGAARAHSGDDPYFAADVLAGDAFLERLKRPAAERDLGQMEFRHASVMAN